MDALPVGPALSASLCLLEKGGESTAPQVLENMPEMMNVKPSVGPGHIPSCHCHGSGHPCTGTPGEARQDPHLKACACGRGDWGEAQQTLGGAPTALRGSPVLAVGEDR